jgi:hypothetical protein
MQKAISKLEKQRRANQVLHYPVFFHIHIQMNALIYSKLEQRNKTRKQKSKRAENKNNNGIR